MPDLEMLQLLSKEFDISLNEILAGEKLSDAEFRRIADENVIAVSNASAFTFEERKAYFKRKWRKEHRSLFLILAIFLLAAIIMPIVFHKPWLIGFAPVIALIEHGYQHNKMMIYVEHCLYDG